MVRQNDVQLIEAEREAAAFRLREHFAAGRLSAAEFQQRLETVFAAIEGKGRSRIGEQTFEWGPRDLFVVPSWHWVTHEADADSVLFSFSDRPVQQKLDLFREDRGNA